MEKEVTPQEIDREIRRFERAERWESIRDNGIAVGIISSTSIIPWILLMNLEDGLFKSCIAVAWGFLGIIGMPLLLYMNKGEKK